MCGTVAILSAWKRTRLPASLLQSSTLFAASVDAASAAASTAALLLQGVFEDDTHVHLVMELCRGGELIHAIGARHYSERTVSPLVCQTPGWWQCFHSFMLYILLLLHGALKPADWWQ